MAAIDWHLVEAAIGFGLVQSSILALGAVGFTLQFGIARVLNIAYGATMIASAFVAYVLNRDGASILESACVAIVFGASFSVLFNRIAIRPFTRRVGLSQMVIVTLALSVMIENIVQAIFGPGLFSYRGAASHVFRWAGFVVTKEQLIAMGVTGISLVGLHGLLRRTGIGRGMRATADNWELARASGVPVRRIQDITWVISGALCGLAGLVLAINVGAFQSSTADNFLIVVIAAVVLGGVGNPYGAAVGALVIGMSTQLFALIIGSNYSDVVAFVILAAVLLVKGTSAVSVGVEDAR